MNGRTTGIIPVRIKLETIQQVRERALRKSMSVNAWVTRAILQGLRSHSKEK